MAGRQEDKSLAADVIRHQLEKLARRERGRLVAVLVHRFGARYLEMAEDVVQDAIVAAMATWPYRGMPENPAAWLSRAARNKAIDRLRKEGREVFDLSEDAVDETSTTDADEAHGRFIGAQVEDAELKLMFLCCQRALSEEDQLMLTLQVVSGFTAKDISALFLMKDAAVGQRLARAKRKLRDGEFSLTEGLSRFAVKERLPTVLKVVYLMFSLGYAPRRGEALVLRDVADEALRLAEHLCTARDTAMPDAHALAALLSFQASRFAARLDPYGRLVLLKDQNRTLWDRQLIAAGLAHLKAAQSADTLSRYHLEAGIAALHATAQHFDETDWQAVCGMYGTLEAMTGSPVVSLNACAAHAFAGEPEAAFVRLEALEGRERLGDYAPYHIARGEILRMLGRMQEAAACFQAALACDAAAPVAAHLQERLAACS